MISLSLAEPPVPQKFFSFLPSSSRSSLVPTKPVISVTALPARCLVSNHTRSFCCSGVRVLTASCSSSNLKLGSVLYTNPLLSGLFFLLIVQGYFIRTLNYHSFQTEV